MPNHYPVRFASQMRQHLRALRKKRGLTQAQLGALVGVSQARIAEIEANPGLVNLEQMLQLLTALGATLALEEDALTPTAPSQATPTKDKEKAPETPQPARQTSGATTIEQPPSKLERTAKSAVQHAFLTRPKKGSW
jgi:HTH-type transcriptional regulator/antitoxin HipB